MALTDLEKVRLKIADRPRVVIDETIGTGNALATIFRLQGAPVTAASEAITLNGVAQTDPAHYGLVDATGVVTFVTTPSVDAVLGASYTWSVFSDDELQEALTDEGSVNGAAAEAIRWILADTDRFVKYTFGQEVVDRGSARKALQDMLDRLERTSGPIGLVLADSDELEETMAPFIEQPAEALDVFTST